MIEQFAKADPQIHIFKGCWSSGYHLSESWFLESVKYLEDHFCDDFIHCFLTFPGLFFKFTWFNIRFD